MDVFWSPPKAKPDPNIRTAYMAVTSVENDTGQVLCRRFQLLAPIGFGATAAVYRALDRETKSEVAVKILYKSLRDDAEALRYFAQEGRLAARIVHPHLLRAHYFGQRRGAPFIVFELIPGASLTQVAALRPIPWRRLGRIVLQVLDALAKLHEEGVLHGDIQPENVIVQQTTLGHDFAKVIDLGFASARGCSRLTQAAEPPAEVHGTPSFIAPERLAGLDPDGRADLYSVGALMYFLLTTRPVPDISNAPEELGIPVPSIMAPGARIPHAIDVIVMRALSDVDDRYPSAAAMAQALGDALAQPETPPAVVRIRETPPPAVIDMGEAATPPVLPASVAEVQAPPVAVEVPDEPEPARFAASIGDVPQRSTRAPLVVGLGLGVVLGVVGIAALWRAIAALDGGPVAQQAMDSTSPHETTAAIIRRSEPVPTPPRGPDLLPAVPPAQDIQSTTEPATSKAKQPRGDARVAQVRRAIYRCKPLVPYSKSTVTVEADPAGKTQIQFSGREAQGDFGRCVGEVAARTKIADGERLSFKL
jgi:serine/threonine-protein kinase